MQAILHYKNVMTLRHIYKLEKTLEKDIPTQYPIAENKHIAKYYSQLEAMAA